MAGRDQGTSRFVALLRRHPVVAFVILAYALSWWAWFWYRADPENVGAPILPIGPLIATALLLPVIGGWAGIKDIVGRLLLWRVGWKWYAIVLGLPVLLTLSALGLNLLLGAQVLPASELPDAANLAIRFVFIFFWIGLGEEPGWRGFVLPRLLVGRTALLAALIVGLIHMVWHLPLYGHEYDATNVVPWGLSVFCFSIVICWIYLHTGGSILMPMLMHASNNTVAIVWRLFEGSDQSRLWWIWCGFWVFATLFVIAANGPGLRRLGSEEEGRRAA
jgi:membrane protease YdiL (CAAX protease family)